MFALHFKNFSGTVNRTKVIELLRATPEWTDTIHVPPDIQAALT